MDINTLQQENQEYKVNALTKENIDLRDMICRYEEECNKRYEEQEETKKIIKKIKKENNELKKNIEIYKKEYNHISELREKAEKTLNFKSIILGSISSNYEEITDIDNLKNLLRIMFELEEELLNE